MATLHIFRGLPGSGKSTRARELSAATGALFLETDMFHVKGGKYNFANAHAKTVLEILPDLLDRIACLGCDVVYAGVLPTADSVHWIADPFFDNGYQIIIHNCDGNFCDVHHVPEAVLKSMRACFCPEITVKQLYPDIEMGNVL